MPKDLTREMEEHYAKTEIPLEGKVKYHIRYRLPKLQ
jgi:hypothetical protein